MLFANDNGGNKTYIDSTLTNKEYFCPVCGEKLICKFGNIKCHHFAHPSHSECKDSWHYDMSEWHSLWQSFFPKEYQEVVYSNNGERHRADISIGNTIVEFQHSHISPEEFLSRNNFYHSINKRIVWVFDATDRIEYDSMDTFTLDESNSIFALTRQNEIFLDKTIRNSADAIFFCEDCRDNNGENDFLLDKVGWVWNRNTYRKTKTIVGIEAYYSNDEFINYLLNSKKQKVNLRSGTITFLWRKNRIKKWAILENENGFRVKIVGSPIETYEKYGKLYGNFSAPKKMRFSKESKQVYGISEDWTLIDFE